MKKLFLFSSVLAMLAIMPTLAAISPETQAQLDDAAAQYQADLDKAAKEYNISAEEKDAAQKDAEKTISDAKNAANGSAASEDSETDASGQPEKSEAQKAADSERLKELQENADAMRAKEHSAQNKALGAAAIGATGIGMMNMLQGKAEQSADKDAEEDMRAYLSTFYCNYGGGSSIKYGERDITMDGGNALIEHYTLYKDKADKLRILKESLDMRPGIESEIIYDKAEAGLYDDENVGRRDGVYFSLASAILDPNGEDAKKYAESQKESANQAKTGMITAIAGAAGGLIGNLVMNTPGKDGKNIFGQMSKERSAEINKKYDDILKGLSSQLNTLPPEPESVVCPTGATGTPPNCNCGISAIYNSNSNVCDACSIVGQIVKDNECTCPDGMVPAESGCAPEVVNIPPKCDAGKDENIIINPQTGECTCKNGVTFNAETLCRPAEIVVVQEIIESPQVANQRQPIMGKSLFASGSAVLNSNAKNIINNKAAEFKNAVTEGDAYCIVVAGFTDTQGSDNSNQKLSEERARAVADALVQAGLKSENIKSVGFGETECAKTTPKTQQGRKNENCRKIEFISLDDTCPGDENILNSLQKITGEFI